MVMKKAAATSARRKDSMAAALEAAGCKDVSILEASVHGIGLPRLRWGSGVSIRNGSFARKRGSGVEPITDGDGTSV